MFEALRPCNEGTESCRLDGQEFKFLRELAKDIPAILKSAEPEGGWYGWYEMRCLGIFGDI